MPRRVVLLLLLALAVAPASAHAVNYVSMDPQVTADGTVIVEAAFLEEPGWLALYADGEPVGHARVERAQTTVQDVGVPIDDAWDVNDTLHVLPRLFADDGDGRFEPDADRRLVLFGPPAATPVAWRDAAVRVTAERSGVLRLGDDGLVVRSVSLPAEGFVVGETTAGERLGSRPLEAGVHEDVSVPVEQSRLSGNGSLSVSIRLVVDDGDGSLDVDDRAVRVDGAIVRTVVDVTTENRSATENASAGVTTASSTATSGPGERTATGVAGFGLLAAAVALVLAAAMTRDR